MTIRIRTKPGYYENFEVEKLEIFLENSSFSINTVSYDKNSIEINKNGLDSISIHPNCSNEIRIK